MDKCKDCYNMNCIFVTETNGCDAVEDCGDFQPMRNSDKIRAMSDEELADWLIMNGNGSDYQTWLDWLRQEVDNG